MKVIVGEFAGSKGTINLNGPQSGLTLQTGQDPGQPSLVIGQSGTGALNITGGAKANTGSFYLGFNNGGATATDSSLSLDGAGTEFNASSSIFNPTTIGTGKISITGGAKLTTGPSRLGFGGVGTAVVDGAGSTWISAQALELGLYGGVGNLSITNGGTVSAVTTSVTNNHNSTIEIQNGTLDAFIYNYGTIENNGAILGGVNNSGVLSGSGTIAGKVTQWGGALSPGNSPGTLTLGALEINSGAFDLEMNSANGMAGGPSGWDLVAVQGAAVINGTSVVDLISLLQNNAAGNVFDFNPLQNYQWTFLTADGGIQGFNANLFVVDTGDFTNAFGGDFFVSRSGNALMLNYAVPEPSTICLAAVGIVVLVTCGVRRKHPGQC
jgi:T5SS/PEP-CTERM-associated repeat protein